MCSQTTCKNCGNHIEQALTGVPKNQRCKCTAEELASAKGTSLFARIFSR